MAGTQPKTRFSKVMEILLRLTGLGVLAENIFLFQQNRHLSEALAPFSVTHTTSAPQLFRSPHA
jgi:hypothetical protein